MVERSSGIARDALGLGLRPAFYPWLFEHWPRAIDYFEIISENFITSAPGPQRKLAEVHARYPVVLHGVGLNLLGHAPLDEDYLDAIAQLADLVDAPFVTDHLCWTGAHGVSHHDLLPTPYVPELVELAAERARRVQARLGRPFGLENLSTYAEFRASSMSEVDFYTNVVQRSGCWFMLDINNIYVSGVNHCFDPRAYIDRIDFDRVLQVHLAGHSPEPDGTIVDTHDRSVCSEVWDLYRYAWDRGGPFPTLLEWDASIPEMPVLLQELDRAVEVRR